MTRHSITVNVVDYGRKYLYMRYKDPETGLFVTESTRCTTRKDAQKAAGALESKLNSGTHVRTNRTHWQEFRARYEKEVLPGLAVSTQSKVTTTLDRLEDFFRSPKSSLGTLASARSITPKAISGFQSWLREQPEITSETTVLSYMGHLRSLLSWAHLQGVIPAVPRITKLPRAKRTSADTPLKGRALTDAEFRKFKAKAPTPGYAFYVEGLWLSGLRLEESLEFYWEPTPGKLFVVMGGEFPLLSVAAESEKGKKDRLLPITPDFAEFLLGVPEVDRHGKVFKINPDGSTPCKYHVSHTLIEMGRKAGIVVNSVSKHASAHDLRRSFGDRWALRVEPLMLQMLMRHESIQTTMRFYVGRNALKAARLLHEQFGGNGQKQVTLPGNTRQKRKAEKQKTP